MAPSGLRVAYLSSRVGFPEAFTFMITVSLGLVCDFLHFMSGVNVLWFASLGGFASWLRLFGLSFGFVGSAQERLGHKLRARE